MILPVLKENSSYCTILETYCQEVSRYFCIFFLLNNILTVEQEPTVQAQLGRGTGRVEERMPSSGPGARALTAALGTGFRREGPVALPDRTSPPNRPHEVDRAVFPSVRLTVFPCLFSVSQIRRHNPLLRVERCLY